MLSKPLPRSRNHFCKMNMRTLARYTTHLLWRELAALFLPLKGWPAAFVGIFVFTFAWARLCVSEAAGSWLMGLIPIPNYAAIILDLVIAAFALLISLGMLHPRGD